MHSAALEAICNTCDNFFSPSTRAVTHTAHTLAIAMTFSIVVLIWFCFFQPAIGLQQPPLHLPVRPPCLFTLKPHLTMQDL